MTTGSASGEPLGPAAGRITPASSAASATPDASRRTDRRDTAQSLRSDVAPISIRRPATSIDGDPARFQRYQDVRDGVMFTDARYASESPEGDWRFRAAADNVGYRDQRYFADYERTGRFKVVGPWDEIPQFYSVDTATRTRTPTTIWSWTMRRSGRSRTGRATCRHGSRSLRSSSCTSAATSAPSAWWRRRSRSSTSDRHLHDESARRRVALGRKLRIRQRRRGAAALRFAHQRLQHRRAVEQPAQHAQRRYTGSWFNNLDTPLIWDSPLRLDDSTSAPGRGAPRSGRRIRHRR